MTLTTQEAPPEVTFKDLKQQIRQLNLMTGKRFYLRPVGPARAKRYQLYEIVSQGEEVQASPVLRITAMDTVLTTMLDCCRATGRAAAQSTREWDEA